VLRNKRGRLISDVDTWPRPKRDYQWKAGRSAMELARSWFRGETLACPSELLALLESHDLTRGCTLVGGQPEFVTPLPERGEGRNHDLWLTGTCAMGGLTICVEAKADEQFGERIGDAIDAARRRTPQSGMPARAKALLELLLGRPADPEHEPWCALRYQLLTGIAGTAIQAVVDDSAVAAFVVQEFCGADTSAALQQQNDGDLNGFMQAVFPAMQPLNTGRLSGPITLAVGSHLLQPVQVLVGKIRSEIPTSRNTSR